jgi:hypothetical protein
MQCDFEAGQPEVRRDYATYKRILMKRLLILSGVLVLAIRLAGQTGGMRLEGCLDPAVLAKALAAINQMSWRGVSIERAREVWPTELTGFFDPSLRSDLSKGLTSTWSDGRVIGGYKQCGEELTFATDRKRNGSATKRLDAIQIDYSARTREQVVTAARAFARAIELPNGKIATIGRDAQEDREWVFQWDTASKRDFGSIEINRELSQGRYKRRSNNRPRSAA